MSSSSRAGAPDIDFNSPFYDRLRTYLDRFNDSGFDVKVMVSVSLIDSMLGELIEKRLPVKRGARLLLSGANPPIGSFAAKIDLAYALGLLWTREHKDLHRLRKIRNQFAHRFDADFNEPKIRNISLELSWGQDTLDALASDHPSYVADPQQRAEMIVISLVMGIYGREAEIQKLKSVPLPEFEPSIELYLKNSGLVKKPR